MPVVIYKLTGKPQRWYVRDTAKDFHTQHGAIPKEKLKPGTVVVKDVAFAVVPASFIDEYKAMKRKAQIITRKDVGFIVGWCGLTRDSVVVESGAGSGGATMLLAQLCKHVYSYEIEEGNAEVVEQNTKEMKNVTLTLADFYDAANVEAHGADLVLLDLPEPWQAYASAEKAAKLGGYVVAYTPTIVQAQQFVNELPGSFLHERTLELIDRDWKVRDRAVRPVNAPIGHTAFLTVVRKIQ